MTNTCPYCQAAVGSGGLVGHVRRRHGEIYDALERAFPDDLRRGIETERLEMAAARFGRDLRDHVRKRLGILLRYDEVAPRFWLTNGNPLLGLLYVLAITYAVMSIIVQGTEWGGRILDHSVPGVLYFGLGYIASALVIFVAGKFVWLLFTDDYSVGSIIAVLLFVDAVPSIGALARMPIDRGRTSDYRLWTHEGGILIERDVEPRLSVVYWDQIRSIERYEERVAPPTQLMGSFFSWHEENGLVPVYALKTMDGKSYDLPPELWPRLISRVNPRLIPREWLPR